MADLFVDFIGGNNSNTPTTFAGRALTITGGILAGDTAAGDRIKIMKSETPVSIGSATWTNKSATVTLNAALTKTIYLDGAWTAAANVTANTGATRKEGSTASQIAPAGAFGTGKAAYYDLGSSQDFSAFDSICLQMRSFSGNHAAGLWDIKLCSDATGDTPVESFTVNEALSSNHYRSIFISKGSALSATVRSVAIYANSDPGTNSVMLDNILGCNANSIDLTSVITKNSSETGLEYYAIKSIVDTTVVLDISANSLSTATQRGYYGTTESVTTYKVRPIRISATQTIQEAGTAAAKSTYSGGWDMTDMSTQTGITIVDFGDENGNVFSTTQSHLNFEKIYTVRGTRGFNLQASNLSLTNCGVTASNDSSGGFASVSGNAHYFNNCYAYHCASRGFGVSTALMGVLYDTCTSNSHAGSSGFVAVGSSEVTYLNCTSNNHGTAGWDVGGGGFYYINKPTAKDSATAGFAVTSVSATIIAPTTSANGAAFLSGNGAIIYLDDTANCSDATVYSTGSTAGIIKVSRVAGAASDERFRIANTWVVEKTSALVHGSSTYSYKHTPLTGIHVEHVPLVQKTKPFAVSSAGTLTISVWARRTHATNVGGKIVVRGMQVDGISTDQTDSITAAADTWEELTITGSPSENVPIEVEWHSWNNTTTSTASVYFSDPTVTQS